jgi:hypothetical protein
MATVLDDVMAESERKPTTPVRLEHDAIETAKVAASLKGMTLMEYASAVLLEVANRDIDEYAKARSERAMAKAKEAAKQHAEKRKGGG